MCLILSCKHAFFGAVGLWESVRAVFDKEGDLCFDRAKALSTVGSFFLQVRIEGGDDGFLL
jgi:hypothetical protein